MCRSCANYASLEDDDSMWTCKFCKDQLKNMRTDTPEYIPHRYYHASEVRVSAKHWEEEILMLIYNIQADESDQIKPSPCPFDGKV